MAYIEGDGPRANLYHLLWQKEGPYVEKSSIRIPDTLIFLHGMPTMWYFTSSEGKILKKRSQNLTYDNIIQKFTSWHSEDEIVASFISTEPVKLEDKLLSFYKRDNSPEEVLATPRCPIEFYTAADFKKVFSNMNTCKDKTGILQGFIKPYGQHNELIQAVWSPKLCIFTKKMNCRRLDEFKYNANERALTFEGPDYCSKTISTLGKNIPNKIREACEAIANHIINVSYEQISIQRLVAYFKVDENERVYFLWADSIRIREFSRFERRSSAFISKPVCLEPCVRLNKFVNRSQDKRANNSSYCEETSHICIACDSSISSQLFPISYKLLIRYFDRFMKNNSQISLDLTGNYSSQALRIKDSNTLTISQTQKVISVIPSFIRKLYPELRVREYHLLKVQDQFLLQTTNVCEECFLKFTKKPEKKCISNNLSKNTLTRPQRPFSSIHSDSRSSTPGRSNVFRRRSIINQNINEENILEVTEHDKTVSEEKSELIKLIAKARPHSTSKIPSDTCMNSNASMTTLGSNIPSFLAFRRSIFSNRRDSQSFLEKSDIEGLSQNQKSSPARLKNLNISQQLNEIVDKLPNRPSSLNEVHENSILFSKPMRPSSCLPVDKEERRGQLRNRRTSSKNRNPYLDKGTDDIEDLFRASIENFSMTKTNRINENQSKVKLNNQSNKEEKNPGNGKENCEDLSYNHRGIKKNQDVEIANNIRGLLDKSLIYNQEKSFEGTFENFEESKDTKTKNFFIQKQYPMKFSQVSARVSQSKNFHNSRSLPKEKNSEAVSKKNLISSANKNKVDNSGLGITRKVVDRNQKSFQMEKVYLSQINISHLKNAFRFKKKKDMIFH